MFSRHWSFASLGAALVLGLGVLFAASGADAQNLKKKPDAQTTEIITGTSYDAIISVLEDNGFSVDMDTDSDGDPLITSTDDDQPFAVHFYGCTDGDDCEYVDFTAGWEIDAPKDAIEQWNNERVWGRAYVDEDGHPWLDMAVNLKGGVTKDNFDDTVSWWWSALRDFEDAIGWNGTSDDDKNTEKH